MRLAWVAVCAVAAAAVLSCSGAANVSPLPKLPPHPRLIVTDDKLDAVLAAAAHDPEAASLLAALKDQGAKMLQQPPVQRPPPGPSGILITVRVVVGRVMTLGLLHLLNVTAPSQRGARYGGVDVRTSTWSVRAEEEMRAFANFSDWNPPHFLDTAEGVFAMAIGVDWLHDAIAEDSLALFKDALAQLGLQQGRAAFNGTSSYGWWAKSPSNWNQVCSGSLAVGALAIGDEPEYADLAAEVFADSIKALPISIDYWAPHGAWWEGDTYTGYAAKYLVGALASIESALGDDASLALAGVNMTGRWMLDSIGPSGYYFNWADASAAPERVAASNAMWYGWRFKDPLYSYLGRALVNATSDDTWGSTAFALLHYSGAGSFDDVTPLPPSALYDTRYVGILRSKWTPIPPKGAPHADAAFLAFKGGNNAWTHGHLDQGGFVFEMFGTRWGWDLGAGSYALPGYFNNADRWKYYRTNSSGHNVLQFDGGNQVTNAVSPIVTFNASGDSEKGDLFGIVNTTAAYADQAGQVLRGLALLSPNDEASSAALIVDEITAAHSGVQTVTWAMHTMTAYPHAVLPGNRSGYLAVSSATVLTIAIAGDESDCPGATLDMRTVHVAPPQRAAEVWTKVSVTAPAQTCKRVAVAMGRHAPSPSLAINKLADWQQLGPVGASSE